MLTKPTRATGQERFSVVALEKFKDSSSLESFSCVPKDFETSNYKSGLEQYQDIDEFLKERALDHVKQDLLRTFLLVNQQQVWKFLAGHHHPRSSKYGYTIGCAFPGFVHGLHARPKPFMRFKNGSGAFALGPIFLCKNHNIDKNGHRMYNSLNVENNYTRTTQEFSRH
ncbi:MAG: hypothetical protein LKJ06_07795 [Schleiferilactobacillus harbinensis]|nr:hypothetical protein [Schleiferilactobacillus harbinensis]